MPVSLVDQARLRRPGSDGPVHDDRLDRSGRAPACSVSRPRAGCSGCVRASRAGPPACLAAERWAAFRFNDLHKSFGAVQALRGVTLHGRARRGARARRRERRGQVHAAQDPRRHRPPRSRRACGSTTCRCIFRARATRSSAASAWSTRRCWRSRTSRSRPTSSRAARSSDRGGRLDEAAMRARTRGSARASCTCRSRPTRAWSTLSAAHAQLRAGRARAGLRLPRARARRADDVADRRGGRSPVRRARATSRRAASRILFVSHRLPEVFRLCDRITVLRDGPYVGTVRRARRRRPTTIVRAMVGREPPARVARRVRPPAAAPGCSIRGLTRRRALRDVSLDVRRGRNRRRSSGWSARAGPSCSKPIFGLRAADARARSRSTASRWRCDRRATAARAGLALVPEDRQRQGLFFNLTHPAQPRAAAVPAKAGVRSDRATARSARSPSAQVEDLADQHAVGRRGCRIRSAAATSRRSSPAKWLATSPRVLLLDEPTKGVDVGAKFEIHDIVREQARRRHGAA